MGKMAPSAALLEEPGSGSLARGRPHQFHRSCAALNPTLETANLMDICLSSCWPSGKFQSPSDCVHISCSLAPTTAFEDGLTGMGPMLPTSPWFDFADL